MTQNVGGEKNKAKRLDRPAKCQAHTQVWQKEMFSCAWQTLLVAIKTKMVAPWSLETHILIKPDDSKL